MYTQRGCASAVTRVFQNLDFGSNLAIPLEFGAIIFFKAHLGAPNSKGTAEFDPKSEFWNTLSSHPLHGPDLYMYNPGPLALHSIPCIQINATFVTSDLL